MFYKGTRVSCLTGVKITDILGRNTYLTYLCSGLSVKVLVKTACLKEESKTSEPTDYVFFIFASLM